MSQNPYAVSGRGPLIGGNPAVIRTPAVTASTTAVSETSDVVRPTTIATSAMPSSNTYNSAMTGGGGGGGMGGITESRASGATSKNLVLQRRVRELLDVPVSHELKELVDYLDALTPLASTTTAPSSSPSTTTTTTTTTGVDASASGVVHKGTAGAVAASLGPGTVARRGGASAAAPSTTTATEAITAIIPSSTTSTGQVVVGPPSPQALRAVLDARATSIHKEYLHQFASLYDTFKAASASVQQVHQHATSLAKVVNAQAVQTESLVLQLTTLQTELQLVQQRNEAVREFKQKFLFGAEEQRTLEKDPITPAYLDVLDRAREVHRKSRVLLAARRDPGSTRTGDDTSSSSPSSLSSSSSTNAAASAVMESTYTAIVHATMRIARYVSTALSTSPVASHGAHGGEASSAREMMLSQSATHSVTSDEPDMPVFLLRCLRLLRQEDVPQWEQVMEEVARLRRASVLRQYHHLLSSGSDAHTSSGTYRSQTSGGSSRASTTIASSSSMHGARPLEAELDDPLFFFSSLLAWLHQTAVVEKNFMHRVWEASEQTTATNGSGPAVSSSASPSSSASEVKKEAVSSIDMAPTRLTESALLSNVFSGVCKQMASVLEASLLRLSRVTTSSAYLSSITRSAQHVPTTSTSRTATTTTTTTEAATSHANRPGGVQVQNAETGKGPRGLTGRLTKLLFAATGKSMQPRGFTDPQHGSVDVSGGGSGSESTWGSYNATNQTDPRLAPYTAVHTREQQVATASGLLESVLRVAQTTFSLVQVFEYYSAAAFAPLLGVDAELTVYVGATAKLAIAEVNQQLLNGLVTHWLDSVSAMVVRQTVLRRLASATAAESVENDGGPHNRSGGATDGAVAPDLSPQTPPRGSGTHFVLDYLLTHPEVSNNSNTSGSGVGPQDEAGLYNGNAEQVARRAAFELTRALHTLILPCAPEIGLCVELLTGSAQARVQQESMLAAVQEATASVTASDGSQMEAVSQLALFLGEALAHFSAFLLVGTHSPVEPVAESTTTTTTMCSLPPTFAVLRDRVTYAPLVNALDDACKAVMCLNTYKPVICAMETIQSTVTTNPNTGAPGTKTITDTTTATTTATVTASFVLPRVASLKAEMETAWQHARGVLLALLTESAAQTYFSAFLGLARLRSASSSSSGPASLGSARSNMHGSARAFSAFPPELIERLAEKRAMAASASTSTSTTPAAAAAGAAAAATIAPSTPGDVPPPPRLVQRVIKDVLADLYDFYGRVAASGTMPPVPLLEAVADERDRAALAHDLLRRVCEQYALVYEETKALVAAPVAEHVEMTTAAAVDGAVDSEGRIILQAGEWAAFVDMEPRKLRVLIR